ncbi:RIP metalloprotease RseP [Moorella naiadis]|uniref:RIP metalloprotease RseP n=1 Tax=Moorella naiadis (nom. illeg.) TaxID=3093670 RepID=UPI003D9CA1C7
MTIILALIMFSILVLVHEGGHFLAAKRAGIKVEEFAVGMGPALLQGKWGETVYTLRAFPLGGFNRMAGMEGPNLGDPRGFNRQPVYKRMGVIGAGSGMNFLLALVLFIMVFMVIGIPADVNVVGRVEPGMPAAQAGLSPGDRILQVDNIPISTWREMVDLINKHPGEKLTLLVERGGQQRQVTLTTTRDPQSGVGLIGIGPTWERQGLWRSIALGTREAVEITRLIILSLVQMVTGKVAAEVVGPVGIVQLVGQAATYGLANVLNFMAVLSLDLGIINLLPVPALDGSRLVFLGLEAVRGRPINPEKENFIHLIGFALLVGLLILITYHDLIRIFS